jgi:hypothetical protein
MASKRKKLTIFSMVGLGIVLLCTLALIILPWKVEVGNRITNLLETRGFQGVKLTLSDVGIHKAQLQNISIGTDTPLVLKNLDIDYTLKDLWHRNLREVTLQGLALEVVEKNGKWFVIGLENLKGAADASSTFEIPVSRADFSFLPFETMNIADSSVQVKSETWRASMPVAGKLELNAGPGISYEGDHINIQAKSVSVTTGKAELHAQIAPDTKIWQGAWKIDDAVVTGASVEIPPLQGEGTVTAEANKLIAKGTFKSADNAYSVSFALDQRLKGSVSSSLTIVSASMPWKGGRVSLRNERIPLGPSQAIRLDLHIQKVSVNDLMQALTGKRVSATGLFSGTVPVVIAKDGTLSFPEGGLNTEGPGTISMPSDAIPGTGEKIDLVREILKNFQYAKFSLGMESGDTRDLKVVLYLEGSNPDVENGRQVKLNVNLTGDVLDFIRQNAMLLNNPQSLLKQSKDEKH